VGGGGSKYAKSENDAPQQTPTGEHQTYPTASRRNNRSEGKRHVVRTKDRGKGGVIPPKKKRSGSEEKKSGIKPREGGRGERE